MQSEVIDGILSIEDEAAKIIEDAEKEAQGIVDEANRKAAAEISSAAADTAREGQQAIDDAEQVMNAHLDELERKLGDPERVPVLPEDLLERASDRIISRITGVGAGNG